ncbi:cytochrome P450 6a2-like [Episyrphus balteatus]|uniref:cytochrome P450 6a2-like n=1 Tax=Episyrphus balteatus TaxID=286459 RepID=UPI0024854985|nr:cytochrome P450 6a2-like [Episyrphus balteatus]
MELLTYLISIIFILLSIFFYLVQRRMSYWKRRQIPHIEPNLFTGNFQDVTKTRHLVDPMRDLYTKFKNSGPFCGIYFFQNPSALIFDLELIKKILVRDFNNFIDRGVFYNEKDDPISAHLFSIEGAKWRSLRSKLSPTFSSGRMKFMFQTVVKNAQDFVKILDEFVGEEGAVIELKDLNARFTTDVIGSCAFGLEVNSLKDPNAQFRIYGQKIFSEQRHGLIMMFVNSCPSLARKLGMKVTNDDVEEFFMGVVKKTVEYREKNNIKRNDFMNILIDMKNDGQTGLTFEEIAAQTFVFYLAGFETSSSTMSHALMELAQNTEIQDRLRAEVNEVLAKHNDELTYDSLEEMPYMLQVFNETLRRYPVLPFLQRMTIDDYSTGDPKYKIEKGTSIFIPVEPIHMDPEYYPNPEKFDPDRFTPEEIAKRDTAAYMPFGEGPRKCIGLRFGKMQVRIGLAHLIKNFKFSVCDRTQYPLRFDNKQLVLQTTDGIYLKVERV